MDPEVPCTDPVPSSVPEVSGMDPEVPWMDTEVPWTLYWPGSTLEVGVGFSWLDGWRVGFLYLPDESYARNLQAQGKLSILRFQNWDQLYRGIHEFLNSMLYLPFHIYFPRCILKILVMSHGPIIYIAQQLRILSSLILCLEEIRQPYWDRLGQYKNMKKGLCCSFKSAFIFRLNSHIFE